MQLISKAFDGKVINSSKREYGNSCLKIKKKSTLFENINIKNEFNVWMSHSDKVNKIPKGFSLIGESTNSKIAAIENTKLDIFAIQFHPEVTHTSIGKQILKNFIKICKCNRSWTPRIISKSIINKVQLDVGDEKVILALSGGVDSSVVAAILNKAIGNKLTCIFIDTGLLRKDEVNEVKRITKSLKINLKIVNASRKFLLSLRGVSDPEKKRKIIGKCFIDVFNIEAKKIRDVKFLGQGTIYPDVIESSSSNSQSDVIKSHHNVGGLPKNMKLKLIEPIRDLFKDEVRKIGLELGLPNTLINRHPFPGPGLAVRILGEVNHYKIKILQEVDNIFINELNIENLYNKIDQALAILIPNKSVGVMGDQRQYGYVVAIRAVNTTDFMTATATPISHKILNKISTRIINEVEGVARVVYDITSKPPGTIEWE
jgi:GMP synthase (glutamine-hydrolysing)